jgi:antitoxin (DNA-binding transcriptional repressor) of toxin-antitoxin stability system
MQIDIPVTQLRTHIAALLKRLRENPRIVYRITHHREVIAELKAPEAPRGDEPETSTEQEVAAFIDAFLTRGVPKKKNAYRRIRRLCRTPSEGLPFKSLEEAMSAVRGRGHGPG